MPVFGPNRTRLDLEAIRFNPIFFRGVIADRGRSSTCGRANVVRNDPAHSLIHHLALAVFFSFFDLSFFSLFRSALSTLFSCTTFWPLSSSSLSSPVVLGLVTLAPTTSP